VIEYLWNNDLIFSFELYSQTTVATAPKLTASKEAKKEVAKVETAAEKKEKEMDAEKAAFKSRAGKV
jgi:hypothetical protein